MNEIVWPPGQSWVGVDLDGSLVKSGDPVNGRWACEVVHDRPIYPMIDRVRRWIRQGRRVKIMTARVSSVHTDEAGPARIAIQEWSTKTFGVALEVTAEKDMYMIELWDDRAVSIEENTGRQIGHSRIEGPPSSI